MSDRLNQEQRERYARHLVLPRVGDEGQEQLLNSSVLVVGVGGLGSPALMYLAAAGVGRIGIIDNDSVSVSNLQRQIIHSSEWIGKSKVESASNWIAGLNPDVDVVKINDRLTHENSMEILD
ncbi:MAG: ThiF family adenylyltransferase, partial [Candidatus Poseidoniia archaeon]